MTEENIEPDYLTSPAEFDRALRFAEAMLARAEQDRTRMTISKTAMAAAGLFGAGLTGIILSLSGQTDHWTIAAATVTMTSLVIVTGCGIHLWRLRHRVARDEDAMFNAINIVRELFPLVSEQESWNAVQEQVVATRIGRFHIDRPRRRK